MDNSKNLSRGSYREAIKIWNAYAGIQKKIETEDYQVKVNNNSISLLGLYREKTWEIFILLNDNDRHSPDIASESTVPWIEDKEIWTSDIFHSRSTEARELVEKKCGFQLKRIISLLGGGGRFPKKICNAIDAYDNIQKRSSIPTIEEVRDAINLESLARDTSQSLYGNILDWCRDRYNMPKVTFGTIAETLVAEYETSKQHIS